MPAHTPGPKNKTNKQTRTKHVQKAKNKKAKRQSPRPQAGKKTKKTNKQKANTNKKTKSKSKKAKPAHTNGRCRRISSSGLFRRTTHRANHSHWFYERNETISRLGTHSLKPSQPPINYVSSDVGFILNLISQGINVPFGINILNTPYISIPISEYVSI